MQAIRFRLSPARYALGLALGRVSPALLWSGLSCVGYGDVPQPGLPSDKWVLVRTRYAGICGSDLSTMRLSMSPYFSPLTSSPSILGHEGMGRVEKAGQEAGGWRQGERVVLEPSLWCAPRGFRDLCPYCERGETNLCERGAEGPMAPGFIAGSCRDTGGTWAEYFLAHTSQLYRVPDTVSDENAALVEPFAVGLHAALLGYPADEETVLIAGAGTVGLCTLGALRLLGSRARILVLARHAFQAGAAERLGASEVIRGADPYAAIAARTGARLLKPIIGKRVVVGGVDRAFDCIGSSASVDDCLRLTRARGQVIVVGLAGILKDVDWTAILAKELSVRGSYAYHHAEELGGRRLSTYELALEWMASGRLDLGWMVTHRFPLREYDRAFSLLSCRGREPVFKAAFAFD